MMASMRPRGQTPRMPAAVGAEEEELMLRASMRPRGQTPRMPRGRTGHIGAHTGFNEAAGADPADASDCLHDLTALFGLQ